MGPVSLFEDTNPHDLKELLYQIHGRELALPDFQRDFVWDPSATQELIVSIANSFPAGSLLRIRNTENLFAVREFEGAPSLIGHKPTYLVLDGQQRLTSLYQAFYGCGDHRYYLDLKSLLEGKDFDDCIFHLSRESRRAARLEDLTVQADELILPLRVLLGEPGGFSKWMWKIYDRVRSAAPEKADKLRDDLTNLQNDWVEKIDDYRFPVVTLTSQTSPEAVCTIFETLNRTGVKLSVFELLTARFWPANLNLRDLWEKAKTTYPIIDRFQVDPYYLLQSAALLRTGGAPSCKRKDVLRLSSEHVREIWDSVVWGLGKVLTILRDDCGVWLPRWLPYDTILIPMAASMAKLRDIKGAAIAANRRKLVQWFWCSVFGQTYDNVPNHQSTIDIAELEKWFAGGTPPQSVRRFRFDTGVLMSTTPRQRAIYSGAMALVLTRAPKDFHKGAPMNGDLILEGKADDHHIFPRGYLSSEVPDKLRDGILNRTLIDHETNIRIGKRPPSKYMGEIRSELGAAFEEVLTSHLISMSQEGLQFLMKDDFDAFLGARFKLIVEAIKTVTKSELRDGILISPEWSPPTVEKADEDEEGDDESTDDSADKPWTRNGKAWHLERRCSPETARIAVGLEVLLNKVVPEGTVSWDQKGYVSLVLNGENWASISTGRTLVKLNLWSYDPVFEIETLSKSLGVPIRVKAGPRGEQPASVEAVTWRDYHGVRIRITPAFDLAAPQLEGAVKTWIQALRVAIA